VKGILQLRKSKKGWNVIIGVFYVAIVGDTYEFELWVGFRLRFLVAYIWSRSCLSTKLGPHPEDAGDTESSNKYALIFW
jgi:hypothetical protein